MMTPSGSIRSEDVKSQSISSNENPDVFNQAALEPEISVKVSENPNAVVGVPVERRRQNYICQVIEKIAGEELGNNCSKN